MEHNTLSAGGYRSPGYAESLADVGLARALPHCDGWVLERPIPGTAFHDAMGCYPLFVCCDWSQVEADLADLADDLVCLSVVTDPFGRYDRALLERCFPDKVLAFKEHFCVDLSRAREDFVCRHHKRYARKALETLHIQQCHDPQAFLEDWVQLYAHLIRRHGITGLAAFSWDAFARQFEVPGLVAFHASQDGVPAGMLLWYVQGNVAYYHLGAHSPLGYEQRSSFALFWHALEYFTARGLKWLELGAGAGLGGDAADGLSRFKRGWSTETRTAYFCGRIFNRPRYAQIVAAKGVGNTRYFPAYRKGEFG